MSAPDDAALKRAFLAVALAHAAFDGFGEKLMAQARDDTGMDEETVARLFPDGPLSLIEFYSADADARMLARLGEVDLTTLKIRTRIALAVKTRIAVLHPHKDAARRAAAFLSLPPHAALAAKLLYRTVDAIWRAAGDTSTDFNFYTQRGILAGVYSSTLMRWFNDTGEDEAATDAFLAARIENVMQFEKFKAAAKKRLAHFSGLFSARR